MNENARASGSRYTVNENAMRRLGYSDKQIGKMPADPENATQRVMRNRGLDRNLLELASVRYAPRESARWFIERRMDPVRQKKSQNAVERIRATRPGRHPFFNWLRLMLLAKPGTVVKSDFVKCLPAGPGTYIAVFPLEGIILTLRETVTTGFRQLVPFKVVLSSKRRGHVFYTEEEDGIDRARFPDLETVLKLTASKGSGIQSLVEQVHRFIKRFRKVSEDVTGEHLFVRIAF